jgi:thioredoxin reductase
LRISKEVTIYTHGNLQLAEDIKTTLETSPAPMKVDPRKVVKLEKAPSRSEIVLHFEDGLRTTEGFLAHKPQSKLRGNLHEQLNLALGPKGTVLANPPFNQSSLKGAFVAGDVSSPMQTATTALASGTSTGAGAPLQIQAEMWNQKPLF